MKGPTLHPTSYLCHGAQVIGDVTLERGCFVGPNAILRGDIEPIVVGEGSNIQDNCVLHTHKGTPVQIGRNVSIGHGAIVHGATVEDDCLIGMNAVVLDRAVVGQASVIGALSLVPQGMQVPPASLVVGIPGRIVKSGEAIADMAKANSRHYHAYREEHRNGSWATVVGSLPKV